MIAKTSPIAASHSEAAIKAVEMDSGEQNGRCVKE